MYWETALGWQPYVPEDKLLEDVKDWLVNPHPNGHMVGGPAFLGKLYKEISLFLLEEYQQPDNIPTLDQWVSRASWMKGKGGTGRKIFVRLQGKRVGTRTNKGVEATYMTDEQIKRELTQVYPQKLVILQKSETAKIRPVAKSDNQLFRKMDFLSYPLENGLKGSRSSPLFLGLQGNEMLDMNICERLPMGINCPLDQGSFDNNQSKPTILIALIAIYDVVISKLSEEYKQVWEAMWDSVIHPESRVIVGNHNMPWNNGLPSGWRWTGLIGTLLNIGVFRVCVRIAQGISPRVTYFDAVHQGDDIHFKATTLFALSLIISVMRSNGYAVHPEKTYFSKERSEFLRRSYEKKTIIGYLARSLTAMRFRSPIAQEPISRASRVFERMSILIMALQRGACPSSVAAFILEDCAQIGVSHQIAADYALTPNAAGGVGLHSGREGVTGILRRHSTGKWITSETKQEWRKTADVNLGHWNSRIQAAGGLDPEVLRDFTDTLLASWGVTQGQIQGSVVTTWKEVEPFEPLRPEGGLDLPPGNSVWEPLDLPVLLLPVWKEQRMRNGDWMDYIKQEYKDTIAQLESRVSYPILKLYLTGVDSVPSPTLEGVGAKYGAEWKREASKLVRRALSARGTNQLLFKRRLYWIELKARYELSRFSQGWILAS